VYGQVEGDPTRKLVFSHDAGAALTTPRARIVSLRPVVGRMIRVSSAAKDSQRTRLAVRTDRRACQRQAYLGVYRGSRHSSRSDVTDRFSMEQGRRWSFHSRTGIGRTG
jgi:hypothetical protein